MTSHADRNHQLFPFTELFIASIPQYSWQQQTPRYQELSKIFLVQYWYATKLCQHLPSIPTALFPLSQWVCLYIRVDTLDQIVSPVHLAEYPASIRSSTWCFTRRHAHTHIRPYISILSIFHQPLYNVADGRGPDRMLHTRISSVSHHNHKQGNRHRRKCRLAKQK